MGQFPSASTRARMAFGTGMVAAAIVAAAPAAARAQNRMFDLPSQDAAQGIPAFAAQAGVQIIARPESVRGHRTNAVRGAMSVDEALRVLLQGTGLSSVSPTGNVTAIIVRPTAAVTPPQAAPVAQAPATTGANDIVVTAQRREQTIQDVPIAISAFNQESLNKQKIEAGPDLLKAIPNLTFSKNNFAGFNLSIRGVGTKAISASTDPGVAIDFNSTTLITSRFFEQEFFDLERIEVLRGPQGTLYGRNATGGVVNIISAKPVLTQFDGYIKAEVGNFDSRRLQGAINVPIIDEVLGVRLAGAYTQRDGFTTNDLTGNRIDGRDLYTTRLTVGFEPASNFRADFVWERFKEDDNRARTAKQLCNRDPGIQSVTDADGSQRQLPPSASGFLSQGCKPGSLYGDEAYGVPNGLSLAYVLLAQNPFIGATLSPPLDIFNGFTPLIQPEVDPYEGTRQTRDLRRISSVVDPRYRATANVYQLNASWDVSDTIQLTSQTVYNTDYYYSTQDYNRFATRPIFNNSSVDPGLLQLTPGGFFNDPQLGRSDRLFAQDLITARSEQFSQELRFSTKGNGPLQVTGGGNYTYYKNQSDYYIFINALTAIAQSNGVFYNQSVDPTRCGRLGGGVIGEAGTPAGCIYIDPNPLSSINGDGHNYFRSSNPYKLNSYGIFADGTYQLSPTFRLIAGARYNIDDKTTIPVPSQLLLSSEPILAGTVDRGYPRGAPIDQKFRALTGRAGFQWDPQTSFTNDTMIYGTYSRGYKAGGTNPPPPGFDTSNPAGPDAPRFITLQSYNATFRPEYVNSFEIGTKNTLLNRRLTLNATAFYYDLKNYQVSQILDRSAVNENFDAETYGLELEAIFSPVKQFTINANIGLQRSRLRNGQQSIDVMDRTQGNTDYLVVKPFPQLPSNCVVLRSEVERIIAQYPDSSDPVFNPAFGLIGVCPGSSGFSDRTIPPEAYPNGGIGFYAPVGGNELPNTPQFTANVGAEYSIPFAQNWFFTPRVDFYHQSESWARVYNTSIDRLRGWENVNFSVRVGNPEKGLLVEAYVKNVFNSTPITDAFINSDDTGLTTNVFTFDPRVIGLNLTTRF